MVEGLGHGAVTMIRMSVLASLVLLLSGCGPDAQVEGATASPTTLADSVAESVSPAGDVETSSDGDAATEEDPSSTPTPTEDQSEAVDDSGGSRKDEALRGEEVDLPFVAGELGVVGVEADDVLNVRRRPGIGESVVMRLAPLTRGLTPTGQARRIGSSTWIEITVDGGSGWVNGWYARLIDGTDDITSRLLASGGDITASTLEELAREVVVVHGVGDFYEIVWGPERDESLGPEEQRRVVISDGPSVSDLGEITVDVIDTFDDSIAAERLTIFAQAADGGFELRTVERTVFCWRAVDDGEVCV